MTNLRTTTKMVGGWQHVLGNETCIRNFSQNYTKNANGMTNLKRNQEEQSFNMWTGSIYSSV